METERHLGRMAHAIRVAFNRIKFRVWERTIGQMAAAIMAAGEQIKCMGKACSSGPTAGDMMGNIYWIKKKAMGCSVGRMGDGTRACGSRGSRMELGSIVMLRPWYALACGKTGCVFNGSTKRSMIFN